MWNHTFITASVLLTHCCPQLAMFTTWRGTTWGWRWRLSTPSWTTWEWRWCTISAGIVLDQRSHWLKNYNLLGTALIDARSPDHRAWAKWLISKAWPTYIYYTQRREFSKDHHCKIESPFWSILGTRPLTIKNSRGTTDPGYWLYNLNNFSDRN